MTLDQIKDILVENFSIDKEEITVDSSLTEDIGLDSLDAVELAMSIEEEYDIEIPDEDLASFETVGDLLAYMQDK